MRLDVMEMSQLMSLLAEIRRVMVQDGSMGYTHGVEQAKQAEDRVCREIERRLHKKA